jgi:hypothetical protein
MSKSSRRVAPETTKARVRDPSISTPSKLYGKGSSAPNITEEETGELNPFNKGTSNPSGNNSIPGV